MSDVIDTEELREAIRGVLADRAGGALAIPDDEGRGFDRDLWAAMASLGWLGLIVPEAHGGLGLGLSHACVLYEELGRELASVPALSTMLAVDALSRHADAAVPARVLTAIAAGECVAALALPGAMALPVLDADGTVHGLVEDVSFVDVADVLLLPVECTDGTVALALLGADAAGVMVEKRPLVDLTRSAGAVTLDGAMPDAVLTSDWDALADHAAAGLACDAVGGSEALFERTIEYLMVRQQFGRAIGSFQALKHRAADWKVKIEAMKALVRHVGALLDEQAEGAGATISGAKAYACDVYAAFAGDAVQMHGGIGFTWEHPCHLFLKRAKLGQQMFGSSASHKDRVARLALA